MSKTLKILITGGAGGIGMATAQVLAKRGHSVIATDISAFSGSEGIRAHVMDVTSDDSVARCINRLVRSMQSSTTPASLDKGRWKAIHSIVSGRCSRQTRSARCA